MNYQDVITDFAKRALANLDLVKPATAGERPDAFERLSGGMGCH